MDQPFIYELRFVADYAQPPSYFYTSLTKARRAVYRIMSLLDVTNKSQLPKTEHGAVMQILRHESNKLISFKNDRVSKMPLFDITPIQEVILNLIGSDPIPAYTILEHLRRINRYAEDARQLLVDIFGQDVSGMILGYIQVYLDEDILSNVLDELDTRKFITKDVIYNKTSFKLNKCM